MGMLKILVADDEELVRRGLIKAIGRINQKIEEIKEASDGKEALRIIRTFNPDIVLTDIKMPLMDGLEMIAKARQEGLNPAFVIISGYEEFSYAKRAMQYGVESYLLKPIDEDELNDIIIEHSNNINNFKESLERANNYKKTINFLKNLLYESVLQIDTKKQGKNSVTFQYKNFYVAISYVYDIVTKCEGDASIETIAQFFYEKKIQDSKAYQTYIFENKVAELVCVINGDDISPGSIKKYLTQISYTIKENMKMDIFFGLSKSFYDIDCTHEAYTGAQLAIMNKIYESHKKVFYAGEERTFDRFEQADFVHYKTKCLDSLLNLDKNELSHCIGGFFVRLSEKHVNPKDLEDILKRFLTEILKDISRDRLDFYVPTDKYIGRLEFTAKNNSLEGIKKFYFQVFNEIYNDHLSSQSDNSRKIIQMAKTYIQNHCFDKISLSTMSQKLQMSSAYLSHLFKKETGYNFIDYVTEVKMKKAKELLVTSPDLKIYEIAYKLGYNDVKYFNRVFKRIFSKTPGEYREN